MTILALAVLRMRSQTAVAGSCLLALLLNAICSWAYAQVDHCSYITAIEQVSILPVSALMHACCRECILHLCMLAVHFWHAKAACHQQKGLSAS